MAEDHSTFHEVWWIFSPQSGDWGGLRIAHFHKTVTGDLIFMISDEPQERKGVRIWSDVSRREGWWQVAQITVPCAKTVRGAKP
jgi:hypothetical protein